MSVIIATMHEFLSDRDTSLVIEILGGGIASWEWPG